MTAKRTVSSPRFSIDNAGTYHIFLLLLIGWFFSGILLRNHSLWYGSLRYYYHAGVLFGGCLLIISFPAETQSICHLARHLGTHKKRCIIFSCGLILLSISGYYNFGRFHGNNFIHYHEIAHYYLGSKYFPELGYHDLYNAFIAADRETGNSFRQITDIRDLRTGELTNVKAVNHQIDAIPMKFTPARWDEFKKDFLFFKKKINFKNLMLDHGYNPSPVWTIEARAICGLISVFSDSVKTMVVSIACIDVVLLLIMFLMIWWAFGFFTMVLSVIFWGANPMVMYDFTGGAFMRQNWLASLVTGICLFKRNRGGLAGAFIANSVGVRLFPGVFMIIPAFQFFYKWITDRRIPARLFRFGASTLTFFCILVGLSLSFSGGSGAWKIFFNNAAAHDKGVYANHVSYRNVFIYEINKNAHSYKKTGAYYHERWRHDKEARVRKFKPVFYISLLFIVGLLLYLFKGEESENGLYIGAFFPFLFFYPANYYAMYLLPLVFFAVKDRHLILVLYISMLIGFSCHYIRHFDVRHIALSFLVLSLLIYMMAWQWWNNRNNRDSVKLF